MLGIQEGKEVSPPSSRWKRLRSSTPTQFLTLPPSFSLVCFSLKKKKCIVLKFSDLKQIFRFCFSNFANDEMVLSQSVANLQLLLQNVFSPCMSSELEQNVNIKQGDQHKQLFSTHVKCSAKLFKIKFKQSNSHYLKVQEYVKIMV